MESERFGIGRMARASGLSISALRFYDDAGVLVPAAVDEHNGYRRYEPEQVRAARLAAALRRVGMPLAQIAEVLAGCSADPAAVRPLLDAHLRRLEAGLADARRELSRAHALLDDAEHAMSTNPTRPTEPTRLTTTGRDLAHAIDTIRYAVSRDPELPALGGLLFETGRQLLRLVATDRYRLALAEVPVRELLGPAASFPVAMNTVEQLRGLCDAADIALDFDGNVFTARANGRLVRCERPEQEYPDYRRAIPERAAHRTTVDVATLCGVLTDAPVRPPKKDGNAANVVVLTLDERSGVTSSEQGTGLRFAVNREFLLQALTAPGRDQLSLELDGPIAPLALRVPEDDRFVSLLMPVRLD